MAASVTREQIERRIAAREAGEERYMGMDCARGHGAIRSVLTNACLECEVLRGARKKVKPRPNLGPWADPPKAVLAKRAVAPRAFASEAHRRLAAGSGRPVLAR